VDTYYYEQNNTKMPEEVKAIAVELRPQLKNIFAKYPTDDQDFSAEVEYDEMIDELTKEIEKLLQKKDELPF
jgi:flagellar basal body-associated protein FliL